MKRVIKFSLLLILACVTNVYTQIQPPDIRFVNLEENWLYISKDTNFVKSPIDKWSSPYWGRSAWGIIQDNNSIYIKESVNSQSPYGGPEGCLLHKLDLIQVCHCGYTTTIHMLEMCIENTTLRNLFINWIMEIFK